MSDQELEPAKDGTHSNPALMREDIPELVQLIFREVAKNVGTGSLKDTYDPREGPSRSEDNDGDFTGPLLHAVPLVLLLVLTALLLVSTICTNSTWYSLWNDIGCFFPPGNFLSQLCMATSWLVPSGTIYSGRSRLKASVLCIQAILWSSFS